MTSPVRVLLVDDDALVRDGLAFLLSGVEDVEVVATASDGDEVPAAVRRHRPDVVLMDIRMHRVDGITATERLRRAAQAPAILVLTTFDGDEEVLQALRAGAAGFLLKDTPPDQIVEAVRAAAAGQAVLSPDVTRRLMDRTREEVRRRDAARVALDRLTDRERAVVLQIARGRSNGAIAAELHMSVATVKAHVTHVLATLGMDNRTQVALLAQQAGHEGP